MAERDSKVSSMSGEEKGSVHLCARVASATDVGRRRRNNQDSHLVLALDSHGAARSFDAHPVNLQASRLLVAVADGMGGHFGGEVASRLCVETLSREIATQLSPSGNGQPDLASALHKSVDAAHKAVFAHSQGHTDKLTMGTTLTAVFLHGAHGDLAQVGDSRAYLFRAGYLVLLTQDQTIGNQLRRRGQDPSTVDAQIQEMLTQAVGSQAEIEVVLSEVNLEPHDFLLLCSDGLYKIVPPAEIVAVLEQQATLPEKAARLVARANEGGGPDNITVILAEICLAEGARA